MKRGESIQNIIILGLTLLAFFLRAYRLEAQSYWIDEAWSVYFANLSTAELWHLLTTVEPLPPFYHPSTIYWVRLMGDSEYAMRFFSLLFGVLAVPLTYRLGKDLGDARLGLVAALLMAVAPYQIWHSQEARMYSALTAASAMSMWGFVNVWRRGGRRWWLVYVAGTVWAIMTHYHGAVLIGVQGLFLLLTWRRHWRIYLKWGAALLLILLLQLPWLVFGGSLLQSYLNWIPQPTLIESYIRSATAYSLNELVPQTQAIPLVLLFGAVYLVGLVYTATRTWGQWRGTEMLALLISFTLAPNLAAWLYGEFRTTVYFERYLIMVQIGFLLTVAAGILGVADQFWTRWTRRRIPGWTSRLAAIVLLLVLVGINGWVLRQHYFNPLYAKPDWRAVAQKIEAFEQPGDAILLTGDGGKLAFDYYYKGDLPVLDPYNISPHLQNQRRPEGEAALHILDDITANHRRLWYTPYGMHLDPLLADRLAQTTYPTWHSWLGRKQLALYHTQLPATRTEAVNFTFGDTLTLTDVTLPAEAVAAGDSLPLRLTWQTGASLSEDVQISLRLINRYGDIFAQSDWPPLAAGGGSSTWPANQPITDQRSLWLPADTPPGDYLLQFILYNPASGPPLGEALTIPNISVKAAGITPPLEALTIPNLIQNSKPETQNLKLIGYAHPAEIQPGQEMWLWLYWQAKSPLPPDITLSITLESEGEVVTTSYPLAQSTGSLDTWQPDQVRRAIYHINTSPRLSGETATLKIKVELSQRVQTEATIGKINLLTRARQFEPPTAAHAINTALNTPPTLTLLGYDFTPEPETLNPEPETLNLTLYWQAVAEMEHDYTVFIQLLNRDNQVVAQVDRQPLNGAAPTTTWLPGEYLTDAYTLPLDLPAGEYRLIAGVYNAATGQRLPVASGGDFVELQHITVQ